MGKVLKVPKVAKIRVSDKIKNALKQAIIDGVYRPGDRLPTEEQIAAEFSTSKVSAREALREMETEKLIVKRRGMYGGSFVMEPDSEAMGQVMINYYQFGGISFEELAEFRKMLEPSLVELAVERCTPEDLEALRENIEVTAASLARGVQNQPRAIEFHRLIADACHNRMISAVMEALVKVFEEVLPRIPMTMADAQGDLAYNRLFYKYFQSGNKQKARETMIDHFDTLMEIIGRVRNTENRSQPDSSQ